MRRIHSETLIKNTQEGGVARPEKCCANMLMPRPKKNGKSRPIPQWKQDMLEPQAEPTAKRSREDAASMTLANEGLETAMVASAAGAQLEANVEVDPAADDDDDVDVDLSAYDLGGDESVEERPGVASLDSALPVLTREELLLKREQEEKPVWGGRLDGGRRKPGKTFFIDS